MPTTTTITFPPEFVQFMDKMLSLPPPKLCDDSETIHKIYNYIERKLSKKALYNSKRAEKYNKIKQELLEIYERIKTKEEEFEKKNGHAFQGPFDYFNGPKRNGKRVFKKIRFKGIFSHDTSSSVKNNGFQEV
jgi:hypothetical protein